MNFKYFTTTKEICLEVKKVSLFSPGLMFKMKSPNLLFNLKREKSFAITSIFCKPFRVILLDKNKKRIKSFDVFRKRLNIPCYGQYLIEVPLTNLDSDEKSKGLNRKRAIK